MKSWLFFGAIGVLAVAEGCVTGFSATNGSTSNGGAGTSSSLASMNVSGTGTGGTTTSPPTSTSTGVATTCPDVRGAYSVTASGSATACGVLPQAITQCIKDTTTPCTIDFISKTGLMPGGGIDGIAALDNKGDFKDTDLKEGTMTRTGCTGTWDPTGKVMTVDCGGMGSGQSCTLVLTHTGDCGF